MEGAAGGGCGVGWLKRWEGGCEGICGRCPGNISGWRFWGGCCWVEATGTAAPFTDECAEAEGRFAFCPPWLMGWLKLVERLRMSLPCTTMLSLDFFRSRVSISASDVSSWSGRQSVMGCPPSPPASKSMTLPIRTLMTPRKPWSFFLNFFWSKICTASTLSSVTRLPAR